MSSSETSSPAPDISVIIPVYNRGDRIRWTLDSIRRASTGLRVETIVIDDGSSPPLADALSGIDTGPILLHRQDNRGLLFARLAGFERARGEHVLFLDSDDLIHPDKLTRQLSAMRSARADVSYSDEAAVPLDDQWPTARHDNFDFKSATSDEVELFVRLQPAPHNPIFRTAYLRPLVERAWIQPSPLFNAVAEIWFYYLCAAAGPARIVKCDGALTLQGVHPGVRLSSHWEKLALGSLAVLEGCARHTPIGDTFSPWRLAIAERAFLAWRALPYDTPANYQNRLLAVCAALPSPLLARLGGRGFQILARLVGRRTAARLLRRRQRPSYEAIRTLPPGEFARLATIEGTRPTHQ